MAKKVAINSRLGELIDSRRFGWLPPGKLSVSEWADEYRYLSPESSSEHGKFKTARTPYMKEAMDIVLDPHIHTIVWKKSAQVGYTEYLLNVIGYFIERNPSPMLVVFPIEKIAESFSLDRLTPMVRDTPVLTKRILPYKAGQSENSKLYKKFPGGHVTLAGANSPSSLASRPIKIVLCDEIDRFPPSSGDEGDPIALAEKRSTTYFDRKLILGSTPTVKGASRIDLAYSHSDQRQYFCPCIHCNEYFVFKWEYVKWPKDDFVKAYLQCPKCFGKIDDRQKIDMLSRGKWEPTKVGHRGIAGFHINEIYSPWVSLASLVDSFLKAKKDVQTLKVWTNTSLGEVWEEDSESLDDLPLKNRAEVYPAEVPTGVLFLTAGVDVQGDRLEVLVTGWGEGDECFVIKHAVFSGDPAGPLVWKLLDDFLLKDFKHESGLNMKISSCGVDSGYLTQIVYNFCLQREKRGLFPLKGMSGAGKLVISRPLRSSVRKVRLFIVGTDTGKDTIFSRLKNKIPGPGYIHFSHELDDAFYTQLGNEHVVVKYRFGQPYRVWRKRSTSGGLNAKHAVEALDLMVYALAAMCKLNVNYALIKYRLEKRIGLESSKEDSDADDTVDDLGTSDQEDNREQKVNSWKRSRKPSGFVKNW